MMQIARTFVWRDDRDDDRDEIRADGIAPSVFFAGARFELRNWVVRYSDGSRRTEAVYDEVPV